MSTTILKEIKIDIKNQHELLNLIAQGYKSLSKSLMEYIDNSFDSAEEFFDGHRYNRNVEVKVIIDRSKHRIIIEDNCEGMDEVTLEGLANSINDSAKKRRGKKRAWVNGQFGLGAHAFRLAAKNLTVVSKKRVGPQVSIYIDEGSSHAQVVRYHDLGFNPSGTRVELGDIEQRDLKNLTAEDLRKDAETYFEMLLRRNVMLKIIDDEKILVCEPFDYDALHGLGIKENIISWDEGAARVTLSDPSRAIEVNLKVCKEAVNRPPYFARKGRRINYIQDLQSFMRRTRHRRQVWGHPILTGYIEVKDNLEPVITRDDFAGGKGHSQKRAGIYKELVKLEDKIHEAIVEATKEKATEELSNFSDHLTDILTKLAKEDLLKLKYEAEGQNKKRGAKQPIAIDENSEEIFVIPGRGGDGPGLVEPGVEEVPAVPVEESDLGGRKVEPRKRGIRVEFSPLPSEKRSLYGDGVIYIYYNHPDFQTRTGYTKERDLGHMKISARLANYLAAVISSEYKEQFYQQKNIQPERNKVLQEQIDFIFRFENLMKNYIDQSLDTLGNINT